MLLVDAVNLNPVELLQSLSQWIYDAWDKIRMLNIDGRGMRSDELEEAQEYAYIYYKMISMAIHT